MENLVFRALGLLDVIYNFLVRVDIVS